MRLLKREQFSKSFLKRNTVKARIRMEGTRRLDEYTDTFAVVPSGVNRVSLVDVDYFDTFLFERALRLGTYGTFTASTLLRAVDKAEAGKVGKVRFLGDRRVLEFHPKTAATITVKAPCGDTASVRIVSIRRAVGNLVAPECA